MAEPTMSEHELDEAPESERQPSAGSRDILDDVRIEARALERDAGMTRLEAEWFTAGEFMNRLEAEADDFVSRYGQESQVLRARLESMFQEASEQPAPQANKTIGALDRLQQKARALAEGLYDRFRTLRERPKTDAGKEAARPERAEVLPKPAIPPVEDRIAQKMAEWERKALVFRLIDEGEGKGKLIRNYLNERVAQLRQLKEGAGAAFDQQALTAELQQYEAYLLQKEGAFDENNERQNLDKLLEMPLSDVHKFLRAGNRHPRYRVRTAVENQWQYNSVAVRAGDAGKVVPMTAEATVARGMKADEAAIYLDLLSGLDPTLDPAVRLMAQKAGRQMENMAYDGARESIGAALELLEGRTDGVHLRAVETLHRYRESVERRVVDFGVESERITKKVYDAIREAQPERSEALYERERVERTMRSGRIIDARPIKQVRDGDMSERPIDAVHGNDKVLIVTIAEVDEDGQDVITEDGEPVTMQAIAKSSMSESYFRKDIPPETSTRIEWQASLEAVAFGSDLIPPTVIRTKDLPFGEMSFQQLVRGRDADGTETDAESSITYDKWEDTVPVGSVQEGAVLDELQAVEDAGEPNYVLTFDLQKGVANLHLIDRGFSQGSDPNTRRMSVLLAAVGGPKSPEKFRKLNPDLMSKLERFKSLLPLVEESLNAAVRFDTAKLMEHKRNVIDQLLSEKEFMPYKGDWEGLRDEGRMAKRYRDGLSSKEEPLPKNVTLLEGDFDFAVGDE